MNYRHQATILAPFCVSVRVILGLTIPILRDVKEANKQLFYATFRHNKHRKKRFSRTLFDEKYLDL